MTDAEPSEPVIVAMAGKMGTGKNFMASFLQAYLEGMGLRVMVLAFGNGVKSAVLREYPDITFDQVYGPKTTASRRALQELGMDYRCKFGPDVWFRDLMATVRYHFEAHNAQVFIIADLRFLDEAKLLHERGVRMILLEAPRRNAARLLKECSIPEMRAQLASHASEMQCELPEFRQLMDAVVPNDDDAAGPESLAKIVTSLGFELNETDRK